MLPSFKKFCFCSLMLIIDEIFNHGSTKCSCHLGKHGVECSWSLFSENHRVSMALRNVFVLRKFQWFFELVNFLYYSSQFLRILSKYRSILSSLYLLPYRVQFNFVAHCFNGKISCFWYYEFSYKFSWFLCIIAHFCCSFCFFGKLLQ